MIEISLLKPMRLLITNSTTYFRRFDMFIGSIDKKSKTFLEALNITKNQSYCREMVCNNVRKGLYGKKTKNGYKPVNPDIYENIINLANGKPKLSILFTRFYTLRGKYSPTSIPAARKRFADAVAFSEKFINAVVNENVKMKMIKAVNVKLLASNCLYKKTVQQSCLFVCGKDWIRSPIMLSTILLFARMCLDAFFFTSEKNRKRLNNTTNSESIIRVFDDMALDRANIANDDIKEFYGEPIIRRRIGLLLKNYKKLINSKSITDNYHPFLENEKRNYSEITWGISSLCSLRGYDEELIFKFAKICKEANVV